jgi:hypothetical protein
VPAPPWLVETVHDLRALAFFERPGLSDEDVAAELAENYAFAWNEPPDPSRPLIELELLRFDDPRVWWEDTEADVGDGNGAYLDAVAGLAGISRDVFRPSRITETWETETGPIEVGFVLEGERRVVRPRYLNDYLDIEGLVEGINAFLPGVGPRFAIYAPFDQTALVVCVTEIERRRLEERGWSFRREHDGA